MIKLRHTDWKMECKDGLGRFLRAHENMYPTALSEIKNGKKESHWIWYIIPQLKGLGTTYNSNYYGLRNIEEANAYMGNHTLKAHMIEILEVLLSLTTNDPEQIFGKLDALKLKSSMTIFDMAFPNDIFDRVLDKFFKGHRDNLTVKLINLQKGTD